MIGIDAAGQHGGEVVNVVTECVVAGDINHISVTELEIVSSKHELTVMMAARANAFVVLPGGFGTLDELAEILMWSPLGLHRKPYAVLNFAGCLDALLAFIDCENHAQVPTQATA